MSEDSMEAADLVPYLLVDERARGLLRNMARICNGYQYAADARVDLA